MRTTNRLSIFALLFALLLTVTTVRAQNQTATLTGTVTDASGAVVPGAQILLKNTETGATYKTVTDSAGLYTIPEVKPGPGYSLTVTRDGFQTLAVTGIYLNVAATRSQNLQLKVGSVVQTVAVSASNENETLDTTDATIGNNFEVSMLNELPVENRDSPAALFYQQPGVTLSGSVTGARTDQSNVTVDGLEVNDDATGGFGDIVASAPVDSVQEFRGTTAGELANAGQGGGGQYELVTKSGTNQFHGALVEYHRDTDLEANDWFNNDQGAPRPPLIRNQFGGNVGGPVLRDRLFFFFDYNGRRDMLTNIEDRTVPLDTYRAGNVSYVNTSNQIETLSPSQVAALDPQGVGFDSSLLSLMNSRFPHANDLSGDVGDLVNTAGFRFNAPFPYAEDDYVQRVDYNMNAKMKIFGVGRFIRENETESAVQFPGDPVTAPFYNRSYSWAVGHNWAISANKLNQAEYGEVFENYDFPKTYNPQGDNQYSFAAFSGFYESGSNSQARTYAIPVVRDDFSWEKGKHSFGFGGTFKWETPNEFAAENFNFPNVGVTGNTNFTALSAQQRPKDINSNDTTIYDNAFSTALGAFASVSSNFNYNTQSAALPQGSGLDLIYRNYETELYFADTWKVTSDLTLSYGLRYQNYTVPYETHGEQAIANINFDSYWSDRVAQSAAGIQGNNALPFIDYTLGGKVNNKPGYYQPQNLDFAPRFGFAYSPSWDRKTVFSGSAGIVYDHTVVNALQFQQTQSSYLFEASNTNLFGTAGNPTATLMTAPRFAGINNAPQPPTAPNVTPPYVPFVSNGVPYGLPYGEFNILINPQLKTPYNIQFNFGLQHQFAQGYLLKIDYAGRLGRRLLAEADASQLIDFPDNTGGSSQKMSGAMAGMVTQLRQNAGLGALGAIESLSPQPWFEDMFPGLDTYINSVYGGPYTSNETQAVALTAYPYPQRGDFSDTMYYMSAVGALPPDVGMPSQFAGDTIWTNKGFSSYNGLLVTLHKNPGYGLQFDLNYTWQHSIDNVSFIANSIASGQGFGYICDVSRPRECRGNSDFGQQNLVSGNFIYELPFGRGRTFASGVPVWANEAIGGWELSGIPSWHTGNAYTVYSNAFVAGFANDAAATLIGSAGDLKAKVHKVGNSLFAYSNPTQALSDFTGPTGFNIGGRNQFWGPGYFNMDLGLGKSFPLMAENMQLKFRADAFNALNHPNFETPGSGGTTGGDDITQSSGIPFGTITGTVTPPSSDISARVLQVALRLEF